MVKNALQLTRRAVLAGIASGIGSAAVGAAPERSILPAARPADFLKQTLPTGAEIVQAAGLTGKTSYAVLDARTGQVLETRSPLLRVPPASVAKAITALYALEQLGPGFRFKTRLIGTGPVRNGRLNGDLILAGGGDPLLDTSGLAAMAARLKDSGLREITGKLRVATNALPAIAQIDPDQPPQVGYNPSISGLNLNFNRVFFEWKRAEDGYTVTLDARSRQFRPPVSVARIRVADRDLPVYTYANQNGIDDWTVARGALGNGGGRWLPVRDPGAYAGEVFQSLARSHGIDLRLGSNVSGTLNGAVLVEEVSAELRPVLRGMLSHSTNITAEVVGLVSTMQNTRRPTDLAQSGNAMSQWLGESLDVQRPRFVDHSGLGGASRVSANDIVRALSRAGAESALRGILKQVKIMDSQGKPIENHPMNIVAKTGTLNFVSGLAGYARTPGGRDLAFAIFSADLDRRERLTRAERERPEGGRAWVRRARTMQNALLERWGVAHDA